MVIPLFQIRRSNHKPTGPAGRPDVTSICNACVFELQIKRKVAGSAMADFSHPA
jgi:hypothetical protein